MLCVCVLAACCALICFWFGWLQVKPVKTKGQEINYGPYSDMAANSYRELQVHFESYQPYLTVTKLVREITVSHWGYASVAEDISLVHSGAKLVVREWV